MKEIRKVFCLKYLNMFSVPLQFLAVCVGYYFIEAISRHSLFSAMDFMTERPLVFLYNAFLIFTTTLIVYLFRRRVFWRTILFIFWMGLGIINGVLLTTRVTPFTGPDLHMIIDAVQIADRYLSPFFFWVVMIVAVIAIIGLIILFIKGPKYQGKLSYKVNVPLIIAGVLAFAGTTKLALEKRVLSNYFGNIAFAYEDYGYPYCLATTVFNTGISSPREYSKGVIDEIQKSEENLARKETLLTKARVIHSMPLYVADKVMNVILLVITAVTALTFLVLAIVFGLEGIHITRQHNQASVQEAEELLVAEDYTGLYDYLKSHQVYGQEGFKKYTERVRLYDDYHAFLRDLFQIQQVLDWPTGQQISPNDVKYVLWAGKNILGRETGDSYRKLEYEENKEYYNDMKQDVAAALLGTFGMSEEELSELMGMERDSEKVDELVRRIFEREGWEYEED